METITLFDIRGEFGCNRILDRFIEQDLKFESFGNLGLKYTLVGCVGKVGGRGWGRWLWQKLIT